MINWFFKESDKLVLGRVDVTPPMERKVSPGPQDCWYLLILLLLQEWITGHNPSYHYWDKGLANVCLHTCTCACTSTMYPYTQKHTCRLMDTVHMDQLHAEVWLGCGQDGCMYLTPLPPPWVVVVESLAD